MKMIGVLAAVSMLSWPVVPILETGKAVPPFPAPAHAPDEDFSWHKQMAPGQTLEIKGVNGDVRAVYATGDEASVTATKHARRSDPESVEIKVVEHEGGVTICAVYPSPHNREPNECVPGEHGRNNTEDNDVSVTFTVHVPKGVNYVARTVNGDVGAADLRSDVTALTVNGGIRISTSGHAEATTVNGSIDAVMGDANWDDDVAFTTVNGGITLSLPGEINAQLRASTVNGDIDTDFPVTVQGRFGPRRISGTLGRGGHELSLTTVNGSITLRKTQ